MSTEGWFRRLVGYALRHRGSLALAFGSALVGSAVIAGTPLIARVVIDEVILSPQRPLATWLALLLAAGAVRFAASFVRRYSAGKLSLGVQHDMRTDVFTALSRLDGARQDELATGQIISRATTDVTMVYGLLSFLPMVTGNALMFVLSLIIMLTLSPPLTLVALLVIPALTWVTMRSRGKLFPAAWAAQQRAADVAGVVEAAVTGVRVVKGFGQEGRELGRLEDASTDLYAARLRNVRFNAWYGSLLRTVPALGQVGVLAFGGWLALHGHITLGTFLAFSSYLGQLVGPIRTMSGLLTMGQQARASVERVFEVIDSHPEVTERPDATTLAPVPAAVELDQVTFGYARSRPVLSGVSLRVEPGETLALVGSAGSGKSTVSLLLPRFYDVQSGSVRVGGHDVRELSLSSLRDAIGVVFEDSFLFSDTVRANIAYGQPDATFERIVAAARAAEADEFIRALPDGYDTVVGEQGLTLSGGQRQRVALARALLTDPRVLLLDDATSAIDSRTEAEIHATLREVMRGRATLLIAHRRSTLELADRIAVLDAGQVVDVGTRAELTDRCALFRLLLSGPGEDAEGEGTDPDTITAAAWNGTPGTPAPVTTVDTRAPEPRGGRGGMGGFRGSMLDQPPTPELLAMVEALPPVTDTPKVPAEQARRPEPDFTLRRLVAPFHRALLVALALVGFDTLAQLALPQLIRGGVDQGVTQHLPEALAVASVVALAIVLADWAVMIGQTRVTGRTAERMLYTLRVKTFAQLQRLGLDYYERELSGRIMTRMTTDIDALTTFVQTGLLNAVVSVLSFVGVLIALLILNTGLALVLLSVLPVLIATTLVFRHYSSRAYTDAREKVSVVNADLQENVAGMRVAQAFGREGHNTERFRRYSDDYRASRMRAQRYIATYFPFVEFLSTVATALVLWAGTGRVRAGELSAGALIAFILYVDMFFSPVQQLSSVFDGYQQAAVGLRRLRELLRTETATPPAPDPRPVGRLRGEVEFDDVGFTYPATDLPALRGLTLTIRPGETVAFVGETGAGKSTAVKLIARFYDPGPGAVRVDGVDLRDLDLTEYRQRLGVVPQESYLFAGTVRDVVAYGQPDATDARVEAAARAVGAHDMIAALPGGYRHPVDERGRNLSAGQRQLLAMARAELVDPDILLLDEATAALDLASEAAVVRATDALTRTRTTVVVAHRLTSAARADRIAVLSAGRLVELGTHADLVSAGGHYAHMWAAFLGEGAGRVSESGMAAAGDTLESGSNR